MRYMKKRLITQSDDLIAQGVAKKLIRIGDDIGFVARQKRIMLEEDEFSSTWFSSTGYQSAF